MVIAYSSSNGRGSCSGTPVPLVSGFAVIRSSILLALRRWRGGHLIAIRFAGTALRFPKLATDHFSTEIIAVHLLALVALVNVIFAGGALLLASINSSLLRRNFLLIGWIGWIRPTTVGTRWPFAFTSHRCVSAIPRSYRVVCNTRICRGVTVFQYTET